MTTLAQLHDCHSCNDERSIVQKKKEHLGGKQAQSNERISSHLGTCVGIPVHCLPVTFHDDCMCTHGWALLPLP